VGPAVGAIPRAIELPASDPDAPLIRELEAYLQPLVDRDEFSGVVLVARGDSIIYTRAAGLARLNPPVPNTPGTRFNLGSMNKMFTAVAVAQLAERGRLSYDDKVDKFLPDYPNPEVARKVTIHMLLTHTSGLGNFFTHPSYPTLRERLLSVEDFLPLTVSGPLPFEPGSEFRYSNSGYILLGAIIERVSGQSYFDYVREQVFKPAGMLDTDSYDAADHSTELAVGYMGERGHRADNRSLHLRRGSPAGGGYSTAADLFRFALALRRHQLVSRGTTETILTPRVRSGAHSRYGYGFQVDDFEGEIIVGHSGGFPGINSVLDIYPRRGFTVIVLSNYDPPSAQRISLKLRSLLARHRDSH
jgi:CubicO group peptidase (beta-lactamase class C family)